MNETILAIDPVRGEKYCGKCATYMPVGAFHRNNSRKDGRCSWCKECSKHYSKQYRQTHREELVGKAAARWQKDREKNCRKARQRRIEDPAFGMYHQAKKRAKERNLAFEITIDDVVVPQRCPALGLELKAGKCHACDSSPSLDEIVRGKGYVKGNIVVVSYKANTMKNNATIEELVRVAEFYKCLLQEKI